MINVLSYVGMDMQSEVCLWTLLGLIRTIFDATLFRVNANLKQVWQMSMPDELSMPVQRALRTMISGVMLVQCFTVYVYLASYIVLLYPVFLEERPTLVLPWLLLAAIRKFLCELTSLALGLGTCVLLGPTRPPCIKFVIVKLISIMPAIYLWMLIYSYYHSLKVAAAFKTFPAVLPASDHDYGLELAIRRRRTKSLLGEEQLRSKIVASLYGEESSIDAVATSHCNGGVPSRLLHSTDVSATDISLNAATLQPVSTTLNRFTDSGYCEDWLVSEVMVPRDTDRILEQFVLMLLRIGAYLNKKDIESMNSQSNIFNCKSGPSESMGCDNLPCTSLSADVTETPPQVGSSKENTASYLLEYPQIFMKRSIDIPRAQNTSSVTKVQTRHDSEYDGSIVKTRKRTVTVSSKERISLEIEQIISRRKYLLKDKSYQNHSTINKLIHKEDAQSSEVENDTSKRHKTANKTEENNKSDQLQCSTTLEFKNKSVTDYNKYTKKNNNILHQSSKPNEAEASSTSSITCDSHEQALSSTELSDKSKTADDL